MEEQVNHRYLWRYDPYTGLDYRVADAVYKNWIRRYVNKDEYVRKMIEENSLYRSEE